MSDFVDAQRYLADIQFDDMNVINVFMYFGNGLKNKPWKTNYWVEDEVKEFAAGVTEMPHAAVISAKGCWNRSNDSKFDITETANVGVVQEIMKA